MDSSLRFENLATDFDILKDKVAEKMRSPNGESDRKGAFVIMMTAD